MPDLGGNLFESLSAVVPDAAAVVVAPKKRFVRGAGPWGTPRWLAQEEKRQSRHSVLSPSRKSEHGIQVITPKSRGSLGRRLRQVPAGSPGRGDLPLVTPRLASTDSTRVASASSVTARLSLATPRRGDLGPIGPLPAVEPLAATAMGRGAAERPRPVTQGTLTMAKLHESDLQSGRQLWRGHLLDSEMDSFRKEQFEFAKYRFECVREAGLASRESARQWRLNKDLLAAARLPPTPAKAGGPEGGAWSSRLRRSLGISDDDAASFQEQFAVHPPANDAPGLPPLKRSARVAAEEEERTLTPPKAGDHAFRQPNKPQRGAPGTGFRHLKTGDDLGLGARAPSPRDRVSFQNDTDAMPGARRMDTEQRKSFHRQKSVKYPEQAAYKATRAIHGLKAKLRDKGPTQCSNIHEKEWLKLPEAEKEVLTQAFSRNDSAGGSGTLDKTRLLWAVRDLGLKGRTASERDEIKVQMLEQIAMFGDVDFFSFCFVVVPQVRRKLRQMFNASIKSACQEALGSEVVKETELNKEQCMALVEEILGNPLMGAEAVTELRDCFDDALESEEKEAEQQATEENQNNGNSRQTGFLNLGLWTESKPKEKKVIFYEDFQRLVQMTQERYERLQYDHLMKIKADIPVHLAALGGIETDILPLHNSFRRFDVDKNGSLDPPELRSVLQEFGFLSGKETEDKAVLKVMQVAAGSNENGLLTFAQFLQVIYDIREEAKACRLKETKRMFEQYDKDNSGQLSVQEVSMLFQEMGLAPTCRQGQDEIKRLLQNCDEDHNGELDLVEFQHLVQLVSEKLRSITRFREMELGVSLKFTEQQIREYRDFFWEIDKDGNGQLDMQELRTLMHMMRQRIDGDDLRLLMGKIDKNNNGYVDFSEFLRLVHAIDKLANQEDSDSGDDDTGTNVGSSRPSTAADANSSAVRSTNRKTTHRMSVLAAKVARASSSAFAR